MTLAHKLLLGAIAVLLVAAVTAAAIYLSRVMSPELVAIAPLDSDCNLNQGPCTGTLADGSRIELDVSPRPIRVATPLKLRVHTAGIEASAVSVDFRGLGMNMGFNRPVLERRPDGAFGGSATLSVCALERMSWEATVLAETAVGIVAAPFRFDTETRYGAQ